MLCRKKVPPGSESVHLLYQDSFPLYKREFKSPRSFAEFDNLFSDKNESLAIYLRDVIKELFIIHIQEMNDLI